MKRGTLAFCAVLGVGAFVSAAFVSAAEAQAITSDPIATVPGYPGCGGNNTVKTITTDFTCANQRTFHIGAIARTVVAVSTLRANGTASTTFTLTGGNAPSDIPLAIRSHVGISSGPLTTEVFGTIPQGTKGPVTLNYTFTCGQVDVKAILTANGNSNGRISGGYFCTVQTVPTTVPGSTTPSTQPSPGVSTASSSAPSATSGPGASVSPAALPATGGGPGRALRWALLASAVGVVLIVLAVRRKPAL